MHSEPLLMLKKLNKQSLLVRNYMSIKHFALIKCLLCVKRELILLKFFN